MGGLVGAFDDLRDSVAGRRGRVAEVGGEVVVTATGGDPVQAAQLVAIFEAFADAEYRNDVDARREMFGDEAALHPLPRTATQRGFDALYAIFAGGAIARWTRRRRGPGRHRRPRAQRPRRGTGALQHEVVRRIEVHDHPADVVVLAGADHVTHGQVLVVREDSVGAVDAATDEVLEFVEAVEPASPWPIWASQGHTRSRRAATVMALV